MENNNVQKNTQSNVQNTIPINAQNNVPSSVPSNVQSNVKSKTKNTLSNKKKITKIICYISLVVLNILLFLPPACRLFAKEKVSVIKDDVVSVLNCSKDEESINATFLNGNPSNIFYKIKGNYTEIENPDEGSDEPLETDAETDESKSTVAQTGIVENPTDDGENNSQQIDLSASSLTDIFKNVSRVTYDEEAGVTSMEVYVDSLVSSDYFASIFNNVNTQKIYYEEKGFSCTKTDF